MSEFRSTRRGTDEINQDALHEKKTILAFLSDADSDKALLNGLNDVPTTGGMDMRRGDIRTAIEQMPHLDSPKVLVIDIANDDQPLNALAALSNLVEPGVVVLLVGDTDEVEFYRHLTRDIGVTEYLPKPLTAEAIKKHFAPIVEGKVFKDRRGGDVIAMVGASGGVGATTIACNLAWFLGSMSRRHTIFVECDLHRGSGALLLNGATGPGLRRSLETPERIDPLFIERAAQPLAERLHLLASQEKLNDPMRYVPGSVQRMMDILRMRYNFTILDIPFIQNQIHHDMMDFCHQRVIVIEPSVISARNGRKFLQMPNSRWQKRSPVLVLNRLGRPNGISTRQVEEILGVPISVVVPDVPKQINKDATFGNMTVATKGVFADAVSVLATAIGFNARDEQGAKSKVPAKSQPDMKTAKKAPVFGTK